MFGYQDPLELRLTGIQLDQPDLPWWYVQILNWIAGVQVIQQSNYDCAQVFRDQVKLILDGKRADSSMTKLMMDYNAAAEAEERRRAAEAAAARVRQGK